MKEVSFLPGEQIIKEGDDGDFLCLIEEGCPECKKLIDGEEKACYSSVDKNDQTGCNCLEIMTQISHQTWF